MRTKEVGASRRRDTTRGGREHASSRILLGATLLVSLLIVMAGLAVTAPTAHAADSTLHIVVPNPSGNVASGPVGANVSIRGTAQPNHSYQLSLASKDAQCSGSAQQQQQISTVTAGSDGSFSATFDWPSSGTSSGSSYYVCATDTQSLQGTLTGPLQSAEVYKVLAQDAPNIAIDVAPPTGTPVATVTPPPSGSFYATSRVQLTGANFVPGGSTLQAYVTTSQNFSVGDTKTYHPLLLDNGNASFTSRSNGAFSVVVTLPQSPRGDVFLHVVSTDSSGSFPPALDADQSITVLNPQPTPTPPTPSPSASVGVTPSTTPHSGGTVPGGQTNTPDPGNVLAVIGLSGLSIILFIVGIILMTSASAMARTQR